VSRLDDNQHDGGLVMAIDPNNPFNFGYPTGQNFWGAAQLSSPTADTHGATHSWSSISAGVYNTADNFFVGSGTDASSSPFNSGNGVEGFVGPGNSYVVPTLGPLEPGPVPPGSNGGSGQSGPDSFGDVTVVNTAVAANPTFVGDNIYPGSGAVGLYGRSRGRGFSIGVLGQSSVGCGLFGLATDENAQSLGIGVVGRSLGGHDMEHNHPVEDVVVALAGGDDAPGGGGPLLAGSIGVLGQSANGSGVRGHGGPLLQIPFAADFILEANANVSTSIDLSFGSAGLPATASIVTPTADASVTPAPGSSLVVSFQPHPTFTSGATSFTYTLTNAAGTSAPATVQVTIVGGTPNGPFASMTPMAAIEPIGGTFSSGQLKSQRIPFTGKLGAVVDLASSESIAQLRLVPFVALGLPDTDSPRLPTAGTIGDLFLCVVQTQKATGDTPAKTAGQLWICTGYGPQEGAALPLWQPVQMGLTPLAGGHKIPLTATPWL
jgi:hypothetical protein